MDTESGGPTSSLYSASASWRHSLRSPFSLLGLSFLLCIEESGSERWPPFLQLWSQSEAECMHVPRETPYKSASPRSRELVGRST